MRRWLAVAFRPSPRPMLAVVFLVQAMVTAPAVLSSAVVACATIGS